MVLGTNGSTTTLHPQSPPNHYIEAIWARDQHGTIVVFEDLSASSEEPRVTFDMNGVIPVPTFLVPYEYCNLHGLWKGPITTPVTRTPTMSPTAVTSEESAAWIDNNYRWIIAAVGIVIALAVLAFVLFKVAFASSSAS